MVSAGDESAQNAIHFFVLGCIVARDRSTGAKQSGRASQYALNEARGGYSSLVKR